MSELRSTQDNKTFRIIFTLANGEYRQQRDYATVGHPVNRDFPTTSLKQYAGSSHKESCNDRTVDYSGIYHCASSKGLDNGLAFGLGSMPIIARANAASPAPLKRIFNGEPFSNVNCEA